MFYLVLTPNDLKERVEVQMAVITFFFAILMGVLFEESGAKANHGNFLWKAMIANYVLLRMLSYIKRNLRSIGIFY
ncbi:MAG TPA: hypothetical protein DCR04_07215 [Flavobacteriales bacterium]|nr:hypothetical protein [Flavobacteriales bacterium]